MPIETLFFCLALPVALTALGMGGLSMPGGARAARWQATRPQRNEIWSGE